MKVKLFKGENGFFLEKEDVFVGGFKPKHIELPDIEISYIGKIIEDYEQIQQYLKDKYDE